MKRRGVTLIELLVAAAMVAIISVAAVRAYGVAVDYPTRVLPERARREARTRFEAQLSELLEHAVLDTTPNTCFVIGAPGGGGTSSNEASGDALTFSVGGMTPNGGALASADDFETTHEQFGPTGGIAEVRLSTTAYGDAGEKTGLFIRRQNPSDGDPTQGGFESVFNANVASIQFEVWDGLEWTNVWDSTIEAQPRLPAAVKVTYRLNDDPEDAESVIVVRLGLSDVTATNPAEAGN